jgi:putative peptidoglycan lipid II flippase
VSLPGWLVRASLVVAVLSVAGMGAGFLLQLLLAAVFGAGATSDAYVAAATIPTLLNTVLLSATTITFIPVFIEYEAKASSEEAWQVANSFIFLVVLLLAAVSLTGSLFSEPVVRLIAPGLARRPETLALAADLQRILWPAMIPMAWSGLLAGLFYARQSFVIPTLAPLLGNGVALLVAWLLVQPAGIFGVALGVLVGNAVQVLFLWFCLPPTRPSGRLAFNHPGVRQIGRLMVPWLLGALIYKANPLVDRLVASQFSAGAISILNYAALLAQVAVFASSKGASLAVFPTIARAIHNGRRDQLPEVIDTGLRLVLTAVIPVGLLLLLLGDLIVALLFERGAFSAADAQLTAYALAAYAGSIVALSLGNILTYVYYALQDTKTPAVVGCVGMALNVALALLLREGIGFLSPAVSYSAMTLFNLVVLVLLLRRRLGSLVLPGFRPFCAEVGLAGLGMAVAIALARRGTAVAQWPGWLQLIALAMVGVAVYLLLWGLFNRAMLGRAIRQLVDRYVYGNDAQAVS